MYIQSGIGNHGTESVSDCPSRLRRDDGRAVGASARSPGATHRRTCRGPASRGGSQTTHAMTRAAHAAARTRSKKLQEIAAKNLGGKPEDYDVANERVSRRRRRSMTLAHAAQRAIDLGGKYDGHELPKDINKFTKASATALAGQGLMGVAHGQLPARRPVAFLRRRVCRGRGRRRDRQVPHPGLPGRRRRRHRDPPARARRPDSRPIDAGHRPRDRPEVGVRPALRRAAGQAVPSQQAADDSRCAGARCSGRRSTSPDPETPVGARGIGEPPVGAGCCAVLNAHRRCAWRRGLPARPCDSRHDSDFA